MSKKLVVFFSASGVTKGFAEKISKKGKKGQNLLYFCVKV